MSPASLQERAGRPVPWRFGDLLALCGTTIVGLLLVVAAWIAADGSTELASQVRWVNVGVVGVIVLGAGNLLWILNGRRTIGEVRRSLLAPLRPSPVVAGSTWHDWQRTAPVSRPVAGGAMTRYHRPDCALVVGKPVTATSEATHRRRGRRPCGMCLPAGESGASDA